MASSIYAAWSVIAGEQPTTAKWNILGSNDSSFNTGVGFNDGIIVNRHMTTLAVQEGNIDWSTFSNSIKSTLGSGTVSLATGNNNLSTNASLSYTVSGTAYALIFVSLGMSSTTDFEFQPLIYVDGSIAKTFDPAAAAGNTSGRATVRSFSTMVTLATGSHTFSPGVNISSQTSPAMNNQGISISAIVLGPVTA